MENFFLKDLHGDLYFGKGAGKGIFKNLKNLKSGDSVTIISPYLTAIFPHPDWKKEWGDGYWKSGEDILLHLLRNGVIINFITVKNDFLKKFDEEQEIVKTVRIKDFNSFEEKLKKFKSFEFYLWVIFIGLFLLPNFLSIIFKISLLIVLLLIKNLNLGILPEKDIQKKEKQPFTYYELKPYYLNYIDYEDKNFNLFISDEFIHSKIFIINNKIAYIGSANFTYPGFIKNYETRIKITDKEILASLIELSGKLMSNSKKRKLSDEDFVEDLKNTMTINDKVEE